MEQALRLTAPTIIDNNGVISTAVGGSKIIVTPAQLTHSTTLDDAHTLFNNRTKAIYFNAADITLAQGIQQYPLYYYIIGSYLTFEYDFYNVDTDTTTHYKYENCKVGDNSRLELTGYTLPEMLDYIDFNANHAIEFVIKSSPSTWYEKIYVKNIKLYVPSVYTYNKIDANYIDISNGLEVSNNKLITTNSNLINTLYGIMTNDANSSSNGIAIGENAYGYYNGTGAAVAIGPSTQAKIKEQYQLVIA